MARKTGTQRDPVVAVDVDGQVLVVRTSAGRTEVPAPVDYAVWTEPVKAFADRKDLQGAERNILVTGLSSARAREGLQAGGWTVRERGKP
jgi:hypothetical protein